MTPISTAQLDAGDSTPKVTRGSLSMTVAAVNQLFSVIELDQDPASMLVGKPLKVTAGGVSTTSPVTGSANHVSSKTDSGTTNENGHVFQFSNTQAKNTNRNADVQAGRLLWQFSQPTSAALQEAASITAAADGLQSGINTNSYLSFATTSAGAVTALERMRIDSLGNVGIGSASAGMKIYASGSSSNGNGVSLGLDNNNSAGYSSVRLGNGNTGEASAGVALHWMNATYSPTLSYYPSGASLVSWGANGINLDAQNPASSTAQIRLHHNGVKSSAFTAVGAQINAAMVGYTFVSQHQSFDAFYLIATLPASTLGTYDQMTIICNVNDNWASTSNRLLKISFGNRGGFLGRTLSLEGGVPTPASRIVAYSQADGSVQIYVVMTANYYATMALDVRVSQLVALVPYPVAITTIPPGTMVYDSSSAVPFTVVDGTGSVGIGSPPSSSKLDVFSASTTAGSLYLLSSSASFTGVNAYSNSASAASTNWRHFYCTSSSNSVLNAQMFGNGNWQNANNSYGGTSDLKLKQDIVDAASQWEDVKALRVKKYRFKNNPHGPLQIGVIAQEVELTSPGLVETTKDQDSEDVTKAVRYSVLYMKSVKALQEAQLRIEELEAQMKEVFAKLATLDGII